MYSLAVAFLAVYTSLPKMLASHAGLSVKENLASRLLVGLHYCTTRHHSDNIVRLTSHVPHPQLINSMDASVFPLHQAWPRAAAIPSSRENM